MKIKYIYSACLEIECNGFRILTDPWFTDGIYDGAWFQYPKIDPFAYIQKPDLIYISHIHADHYDPVFLRKLFERSSEIPICIPDSKYNYLLFKGKLDGFFLQPTRQFSNSFVELFIEENDTGSVSDIDSALIVRDLKTNHTMLNLNDCDFNAVHVEKLLSVLKQFPKKIDVLALGYMGASGYPQTYFDLESEKEKLMETAEKKKNKCFDRYKKYAQTFPAKINLPFAGEYILGGKLVKLNDFRGNPDAIEVTYFDDKACVLESGGIIDLDSDEITGKRNAPHDRQDRMKRYQEIANEKLDYEKEINLAEEKINFMRLIKSAAIKAERKSEMEGNYAFIFSLLDKHGHIFKRFHLETSGSKLTEIELDKDIDLDEFTEIIIDYRYFYGLLTTIYHWNNANVGSCFDTRRVPTHVYRREVYGYLNFFSVA